MRAMNRILRVVDRVSLVSGTVLAWGTVLAVVITTWEVVMRYLFNRPTNWAFEAVTLLFGMQYILAGAYAHLSKSHVRVDVLYQSLSPRSQARLDVVTSLLFFLYVGAMTYTGWSFYWDSQVMWERSFTDWAPPLYPVKFTVFLGSLLLLVQGAANFVRDLHFAVTGNALP